MTYSQNDSQWQQTKIGFDTGAGDTIGNYGCYMTAIANVCSWAGHDISPSQINDICKDRGWLVSSDLVARDDVPAQLCDNLQFIGKTRWSTATPMDYFADASDPNIAYIICIDASHAPGIQTHFVMVWATNGPNDLIIDDSWDGQRKSLTHYGVPSAIIQSATKFIKVAPAPPPPPPVVVPAPIPAPVPYVPPAAPTPHKAAEKLNLVTTVMTFSNERDAQNHYDARGTLSPGSYYVWSKDLTAVNLTTDNQKEQPDQWINTLDNTAPKAPVPAPIADVQPTTEIGWKDITYFPEGHTRHYQALTDIHMIDYAEQDPKGIEIKAGEWKPFWGYFTKNGLTYLIPILQDQYGNRINDRRYGVPCNDVYSGHPSMESRPYQVALEQAKADNREYRKSVHHETTDDKIYAAEQLIARAVKDGVRFISEVIPLKRLRNLYAPKDKK